jgi:hypothetical protein
MVAVVRRLWAELGIEESARSEARVSAEAEEALEQFGSDETGGVDFFGFIRMLCREPWSGLLPPEEREAIPFLLLNDASDKPEPTEGLITTARALFEEADADGDNAVHCSVN